MEAKICTHCGKKKDLTMFAIKKSNKKTGRASECKECHKLIRKNYYNNNKTKEYQRVLLRKKETQKWYHELKNEKFCAICGETESICLDFHHRDPLTKEINVSYAAYNGWSKVRILKEIKKCDILCKNCHAKIHAGITQRVE